MTHMILKSILPYISRGIRECRFGMLALLMFIGFAAGSCRHARASEYEEEQVDSESIMIDSIMRAEELHEVKDPHSNGLVFPDAESQMEYMQESGDWELYSTGILPLMTQTAPKYSARVLSNIHDGFILVDKGSMHVILYDRYGHEQERYRMACGKNYGTKHKKGDCRTPEGVFSVEGIHDSTEWLYTDDDGNTSPKKGQFGPRFIRFKGVGSIGIHGTCAPGSVGGRRSHGCIRLTNDDIMDLSGRVVAGMVIIVSPGPKDMAVNEREGCFRPSVAISADSSPAEVPAVRPHHAEVAADTSRGHEKHDGAKDDVESISSQSHEPEIHTDTIRM